jgi:capsular exopolysaccharide synthesis family protein
MPTEAGHAVLTEAPEDGGGAGLDLGVLLRALLRRLPVILVLGLVGGALGFAAQHALTPRYTSAVALLLEPKRADSFGAETTFGTMYVDEAKIASVVSLISSSEVLTRVARQLHLDSVPEFGAPNHSKLRLWLGKLPFIGPPRDDLSEEARLGRTMWRLQSGLSVERVGLTYVITITARAGTPDLAQRIASAVADAYLSEQVERKIATTQHDTAWLSSRLADVRHDLERSEAAVDEVRQRYGLIETSLGSGATLDRQALTELNAQVIRAEADVAERRARFEQISRPGGIASLAEVESSGLIQALRGKQVEGQKELAALGATFGSGDPNVQRLTQGQQTLQGQIDAETSRIAQSRRTDYEAAMARAKVLRSELDHAIAASGSVEGDEAHQRLREAQRLADENRGLYQALLEKWRDLQQQKTREEPEARIISDSELPDAPSFPKPFLFPLGGAAALMMLGVAGTVLPVLFDRRFATAESAERLLGLPVLGAIPELPRRDRDAAGGKDGQFAWPGRHSLSQFTESLRIVRALLRVSPDGPARILQLTSAASGEGKSTLAAALATSAASAGIPTALIDADLRRGGLSALCGLSETTGLADLLAGEAGDSAAPLLRRRSDMPLAVLGAGAALPARPELLENGRLARILAELAIDAKLIIIDTPPALPVSDALVIARLVHVTILVVSLRSTVRRAAQQAMRRLRSVDAPLAGVLLNRMDVSSMAKYGGGETETYAVDTSRRRRIAA